MERKYIWDKITADDKAAMEQTAVKYMDCISACKTERECIRRSVSMAEAAGYRNINSVIAQGGKLGAGDKVYAVYNEKTLALYNIGTDPIEDGMNILGAHVDSPRIDVKQNPLYENTGFAYFDTHYYGGIKKYQWVTIPLAIHGVIVKKDGTRVDVCVGENPDEPVFMITDILPHLGAPQMEKPAPKIIEGESLDLLIGSEPCAKTEDSNDEKERISANILKTLNDKYGIEEEDFLSAELEIIPAGKARDLGFDRSMIVGYGQDDRICAFTSLFAMLETESVKRTACCLLVDKEEIGSVGASGMQSRFFENKTAEVLALMGHNDAVSVRRTLANSTMLSSDVSAGFDPLYADVFEGKKGSSLTSILKYWQEKLPECATLQVEDSVVSDFLSYIHELNTFDDHQVIEGLVKIIVGVNVEDLSQDSLNYYKNELNQVKERIEKITDSDVSELRKLTFYDKDGNEVSHNYKFSNNDDTLYFRNMLEEFIKTYPEMNKNDKVSVLVEVIHSIIQGK